MLKYLALGMSFSFLSIRDPGLVKKIGAATALEVRATGIPYAFAPCIAVHYQIQQLIDIRIDSLLNKRLLINLWPTQVCRDPRWGRCYESYSEDPNIVRAMTEIILGLQGDVPVGPRRGFPFVAGK